MSDGPKAWIKARWPAMRLRAILFGVLLFTAAMPGLGAVFLRVYENVLVRQTEAQLIAQAAALGAAFAEAWPRPAATDAVPPEPTASRAEPYTPEPLTIDLNAMATLPERPDAAPPRSPPDPAALAAARAVAPIVAATGRTTLASIRILDRAGTVVLGRKDQGLSYAGVPEVEAALAGTAGTVLRRKGDYVPRYAFETLSRASALRVHHARPIRVGDEVVGVLLLSRSPRALFRGIYDDLGKIALGVGVIFLAVLGLAGLLSRAIARPIEQLTAATGHVAGGGVEVPETPATAAVEIRALFDNFRLMARQIDRRSRYLRDFAASVSHEFKTPLSGIRGALELLEEHGAGMSEAERRRFLGNAGADAARLSHLVARLLELARADMAVAGDAVSTPLATPLRRVADAMRSQDLAVMLALPEADLDVAVPGNVIESTLATLVENSAQAGARTVRIAVEAQAEAAVIHVGDDGPGVPAADRDRLFEPFFTTRRPQGGTGLGLPIVRSLLASSRAGIELAEAEQGLAFVIRLPRAG